MFYVKLHHKCFVILLTHAIYPNRIIDEYYVAPETRNGTVIKVVKHELFLKTVSDELIEP